MNHRRSFHDNQCPHCGTESVKLEFCDMACAQGRQVRGNARELIDATTYGSKINPHHHKTCDRCGYEWVSDTLEANQ